MTFNASKGESTIYQAGDMVAHPSHGGCVVEGICDRKIRGESRSYYVLIPKSEPNTTILDPVENIQKIGLHDIMTQEQADQVLSYASTVKPSWIKDNARRKEKYAEALKCGCPKALAGLIKDLSAQAKLGSISLNDKSILRTAQKKLLSEVALAKGIAFESALDLMDQAMRLSAS